MSRARVQKIIDEQLVSDRPLKASSTMVPGLSFAVRRKRETEPETPREFGVVYVDEHLLVVDKPAGLPVHATARYQVGTLVALARQRFGGFAEPAHRLDRETSGLLAMTRTPEAAKLMERAFRLGEIDKTYVALVHGHPREDAFTVDAPIACGSVNVRIAVRIDHAVGRPSQTRFRVLRRIERESGPFALVEASPLTGRQHQIRVHAREVGHPLVGDKIYGPSDMIYDRFTRGECTDEDWRALLLPRHALHAAQLELTHPMTREALRLSSPLPADLSGFLGETTSQLHTAVPAGTTHAVAR